MECGMRSAERGTASLRLRFTHKDLFKCGMRSNACASAERGARSPERGTASLRVATFTRILR